MIDQEEVLRDIKRVAQSFEKTGRSKPKHYGDLVCAKGTVLADLGRLEEASKANIKAIRHFRKHLLSHSILSNNENKDLQLLTISYRREISDTIRSYQRAAKKLFIYNVNKEAVNDAIKVYEDYLTLIKPIHQIYYYEFINEEAFKHSVRKANTDVFHQIQYDLSKMYFKSKEYQSALEYLLNLVEWTVRELSKSKKMNVGV